MPTIRRHDVGDVRIVCSLAGQQRDPGGTALRDSAEVLLEPGALLRKVFLDGRLVVKRVHEHILVIGHDEDEVWLLRVFGGA